MVRTLLSAALLCATACAQHASTAPRPRITGIASVEIDGGRDEAALRNFYGLDLALASPGKLGDGATFLVGPRQTIHASFQPDPSAPEHLRSILFEVSSVSAMRRYLQSKGITSFSPLPNGFEISAPEGRRVGFVHTIAVSRPNPNAVSNVLLHVGFVVENRAVEDAFFRDILGFKLYWQGGQAWDRTDESIQYVSMQVPDGREWIEYMINGITDGPRLYGSDNHIGLGVADIHAAEDALIRNGWPKTNHAYVAKDGKWSMSLVDPAGTRVELTEFKPAEEPCCTEYQQPHYVPSGR